MKAFTIISALAYALTLGQTSAARCSADNCARAVTGTADRLQPSRLAGCSSFQQCTVTPTATTVTVTQVAGAPTAAPAKEKRQGGSPSDAITFCPTDVPSYANTPCGGSSRYASACSCAGITKSTTTLPQETSTVTTTVTTSTPAPGSTCTEGFTCGGSIKRCSSNNPNCFCARGSTGILACVADIPCSGARYCSADSECGTDGICGQSLCCGSPVCVYSNTCTNNIAARNIFRIRGGRTTTGQ